MVALGDALSAVGHWTSRLARLAVPSSELHDVLGAGAETEQLVNLAPLEAVLPAGDADSCSLTSLGGVCCMESRRGHGVSYEMRTKARAAANEHLPNGNSSHDMWNLSYLYELIGFVMRLAYGLQG